MRPPNPFLTSPTFRPSGLLSILHLLFLYPPIIRFFRPSSQTPLNHLIPPSVHLKLLILHRPIIPSYILPSVDPSFFFTFSIVPTQGSSVPPVHSVDYARARFDAEPRRKITSLFSLLTRVYTLAHAGTHVPEHARSH